METDHRDPAVLKSLQRIPGVGPRVSEDLWDLGIREVSDLQHGDPEELYARLCRLQGTHIDRCMLYTLRCAVYFASTNEPDAALLKWWNWKDPGPSGGDAPSVGDGLNWSPWHG